MHKKWPDVVLSLKKQYALCLSDSYCSCVFLIQQSYGECVKDTGWFVVLDPLLTPPDCCTFPKNQSLFIRWMTTWQRSKTDVRITYWYIHPNLLFICEQLEMKVIQMNMIDKCNTRFSDLCLFYFRCWFCWCFGFVCQIRINS